MDREVTQGLPLRGQPIAPAPRAGRLELFFRRYPYCTISHYLLTGFCLTAGLSIAAAEIFIITNLAAWIASGLTGRQEQSQGRIDIGPERMLALFVLAWVGISFVSALVGIDPLRAVPETFKSSIFLLLPFAAVSGLRQAQLSDKDLVKRLMVYLLALSTGQGIAALHSVISAAIGYEFEPHGPGPMTESGQLLLTLHCFICACFIASACRPHSGRPHLRLLGMRISPAVVGVAVLVILLLLAWPGTLGAIGLPPMIVQSALTAIILFIAVSLFIPRLSGAVSPNDAEQRPAAGLALAGALLVAAFIVNLKRGPWLGFGTSLLVLGILLARKRLIAAVLAGSLALYLLGPAHDRIMNFAADYEITGGRKNMWELGVELVERYPLGLGLGNASYMRIIDPNLPPQHRHMHNNFLNVAVESGLIGLAAYAAWMLFLFVVGIRIWNNHKSDPDPYVHSLALCSLSISCAILGWQVAGTVEYNFGDGEIRMIALLMMGLLVAAAGRLISRAQKNQLGAENRPAASKQA